MFTAKLGPMRKKATIYVDPDLLRATKIQAAREQKADYQVIEEALRAHLGLDILDEIWSANAENGLDDESATALAKKELRAVRRERSVK